MFDLNRVILTGRLGGDPVMKTFEDGKQLVYFSLGTRLGLKENHETDWHKITVWGKTGNACTEYLAKGSKVCVEGKIRSKMWTDKEGNKKKAVEINASRVYFLDSGNAFESSEPGNSGECN